MSANPWEVDADIEALRPKRSVWARLGRLLLGLFVVGSLTLALAFYLPLHKAHRALIDLHRETSEKLSKSEQALAASQVDAKVASSKLAELDAEREKRAAKDAAGQKEQGDLKAELAEKLAKHASQGTVTVAPAPGGVALQIPKEGILTPAGDVAPKARGVLCDVAKASGARPLRVVSHGSRAAGAKEPPWVAASGEASQVATFLASRCGVAVDRVSLEVRPGSEEDARRVDVEVRLPSAAE
jgi:hypothetical protein